MIDGFELACQSPGDAYHLGVRTKTVRPPRHHELLVNVSLCSVNPIDAKRASGYGRTLLAFKGASGPSIVLGNDFVGTVQTVGQGVEGFQVGDRVIGLIPTGSQGAHASHVLADRAHVRLLHRSTDSTSAVTLPYSFTTMYQSLKALSLAPTTSKGKRVLVCGAAGLLGRLATQVLALWGADVTAICAPEQKQTCLKLGASRCIDRDEAFSHELPPVFDATLNFAAWGVDAALCRALRPGAMGHATTVHPLMSNTDDKGLVAGGLKSLMEWRRARSMVRTQAPGAKYVWVVFRPDPEALTVLSDLLKRKALASTPTHAFRFAKGKQAFDLTLSGNSHRAVLIPSI